ncbi:hypothetical protein D9M72_412590 [compost metagenome]
MFGALEVEGEGVEALVRAEPDIAVRTDDHVRLEDIGVSVPDPGVDAVGCDDEVGIGELLVAFHVLFENKFDAECEATFLEDVEHLLATDTDEAVARRPDLAALEDQLDIVPVIEGDLDRLGRLRIPLAHRLHRRVREDHPPAERVEGAVALDHRYVVLRVLALHQQRKIEAGWPATDTDDPHVVLLPSSGCVGRCRDAVGRHPGLLGTRWTRSGEISSLKLFWVDVMRIRAFRRRRVVIAPLYALGKREEVLPSGVAGQGSDNRPLELGKLVHQHATVLR